MSKRKSTPQLPSMDDLLSGDASTPKRQDSKTSGKQEDDRVKVTYYLPTDLVNRIDDAHYKMSKLTRGSDIKIHKYDMARVAWQLALQDFEESGEKSVFAALLLGDV